MCSAKLKGVSANDDLAFEIETGLLQEDLLENVKRLQEHGSVVLEVPEDWQSHTYNPGSWKSDAVRNAISTATRLHQKSEASL